MSGLDFGVKHSWTELVNFSINMYFKRDLVLHKCLHTSIHLLIQIDVKEVLWISMQLVRDDWPIQIVVEAIFLTIVGVHMNIWFIIKVKKFELIKRSYRALPIILVIEPMMVNKLLAHCPSLSNTCLFGFNS